MSDFNLALAVIAGLTLVLGLVAGLVRRRATLVSEPMVAVAVGVAVGPLGFDLLRVGDWGDPLGILEQVARLTIAASVMATALRLPPGYLRRHARSVALLLGPVMLGMWAVSGLLAYALLGAGVWAAVLLGAIITPTDPVLAGTIVGGDVAREHIPARLRHLLSAEAGANDGVAYAFVLLPLLLLTHRYDPAEGLTRWLTHTLLWDVLGAVALGVLLGWAAGNVQNWSERRGDLVATSLVTVTVALGFTVLGLVKLLGSDGILAVFVAGATFNGVAQKRDETLEENVQEAIDRLFTFPTFVFFGMLLPWTAWVVLGWPLLAFAVFVLLLRRLPAVAAASPLVPPLRKRADVLFAGWFGPIGVAALYYATYAVNHLGRHAVWEITSAVVAASVVAHGATSTPLPKLYRQRVVEPTDDVDRPGRSIEETKNRGDDEGRRG